MKLSGTSLALSPTDLANFLGCRHRTALDLQVAQKMLAEPTDKVDPLLEALWKRGADHELAYIEWLRKQGHKVTDLTKFSSDRDKAVARAKEAMVAGDAVIVQAALRDGHWFGYADVLRRVETPSDLGGWSYEVIDTKLSRTTRAGTILQLGVYSAMVATIQGRDPERFFVVTPRLAAGRPLPEEVSATEKGPDSMMVLEYRLNDYAAYFRLIRRQIGEFVARDAKELAEAHYPDPVSHCVTCKWNQRCDKKRHDDDHISLVAGISRTQRRELKVLGVETLTQCANTWPLKAAPNRGSVDTYENLHKQAQLQVRSKRSRKLLYELRPIVAAKEATETDPAVQDEGLCRLPEPSPGDVFLDLEGDPYATEGGREYLFGVVTEEKGKPLFQGLWGFSASDERKSFEAVMDLIAERRKKHPEMHVYHYAPYEVTAFRKLRLRYATRGDELDELLRSGVFVDLYAVVRQGVRVGSESYSIKKLEPLYDFTRQVELEDATECRMAIELALQNGQEPDADIAEKVRGYNEDDCVSTLLLRNWLEKVRGESKEKIPRPTVLPQPESKLNDHAIRVRELRPKLLEGVPEDRAQRTDEQQARFLLAYSLDYHHREHLAAAWEYWRLRELPEDDLEDEPRAITGLKLVERVSVKMHKKTGKPTGTVTDRYHFPPQEMEVEKGTLHLRAGGPALGKVVGVDRAASTIDIEKGPAQRENHPVDVFEYTNLRTIAQEESLFGLGTRLAEDGAALPKGGSRDRAARSLLLALAPRLTSGSLAAPKDSVLAHLGRTILSLDHSVLPVQGPPGAGKTYCGARAICAMVRAGKKVGITGGSHRVIVNLMSAVADAAKESGQTIGIARKPGSDETESEANTEFPEVASDDAARAALDSGKIQVIGGTAWLWASSAMIGTVDVLVVDEAGQMALANVLAIAQCAESVVLLGDPQQLEQPRKAAHPDGVDVSALGHMLRGHATVPEDRGVFLPRTYRMGPAVTAFTSEVFYEGRLTSIEGLERQIVAGTDGLDGAGLRLLPAEHDGNRSSSDEEVALVVDLVKRLSKKGVTWMDKDGKSKQLKAADVLVVAPFNAQVSRLGTALKDTGARVGTVDKFQGQEEAVVIYSMATSRPEDAPRGMEFLYNLNRLNVATSRARCVAIVVGSPLLFEPECRTPRQMKLANALCRFRELAS
jgi:predicted RecB family nuclease